MSETRSILAAERKFRAEGVPIALATILKVEGSSYRRPGARMIISEKGEIFGSVSGGCLERDLILRAQKHLAHATPFEVLRYDTTEEGDDAESFASIGLGCQGIVHIGLERCPDTRDHPVFKLWDQSISEKKPRLLATVIESDGVPEIKLGMSLWIENDGVKGTLPEAFEELKQELISSLSKLKFQTNRVFNLPSGKVSFLLERFNPPTPWIIFGAGHDSLPMVELASTLGWEITVVDCRSTYSLPARFFTKADHFVRCEPKEACEKAQLSAESLCVVMTHNYFHDREILRGLLHSPVAYIGLLGPHKKRDSLLEDLTRDGLELSKNLLGKVYSPVGIDLGAETPGQIALSVVAEAQAVLRHRHAGFLRDRSEPLHDRALEMEN